MRLPAFILASVVLLAVFTAQGAFSYSRASTADSDATCVSATGADCPGVVLQPTVLRHAVLKDACPNGDLHVMHYTDGFSPDPLAATWCR
jgi:hypothetical protein